MPGFSLCGLVLYRPRQPQDSGLRKMGVTSGSSAHVEAPSSGENEGQARDSQDHAAHDDVKGGLKYEEQFLEAAKVSLAAGKTITGVFSVPGVDLVFGILAEVIERVQVTISFR